MVVAALMSVAIGSQAAPPTASAELHNITYIARVDGVAPGATATFRTKDDQLSSTGLGTTPGAAFEANTVLADPGKAGMQVSVPPPYSANVHCEIDVDGAVATQVDQFVTNQVGFGANTTSDSNVLPCGAPLNT
jgi:hypothetical protein